MSTSSADQANFRDELPPLPVWRFTVDEYHEMIRTGILPSGAPIELLEGWLVRKLIKQPRHSFGSGGTYDALVAVIGPGWHVRNQEPITTDDSEPEPDVTVVRGARRDYIERHPSPADIGLVVEVADSSLEHDRGQKRSIYAAARIPVYWIVNLVDRCVEVYTQPSGPAERPGYAEETVIHPGDTVSVLLDAKEIGRIPVDNLLP